MVMFHDPLSGEKRKLNLRERTPTPKIQKPVCEGISLAFWHNFLNPDDDAKCKDCGASRLFVNAQYNLRKKGT